jgi:hypothetical protein
MAIKGKGKTRGGKSVAPAPRPVIVTRKPPFYRRKGVGIALLAILVVGIGAAIYVAVHSASVKSFTTKQRDDVGKFSDKVTSAVPSQAQSVGGSTLFLFPNASTSLDALSKGTTKPADSLTEANDWADQAKTAADAIAAIKTDQLIPSDLTASASELRAEGLTRKALADAQFLMVKGLRMYQQAFALWQIAAAPDTPAATRVKLAAQAKALATTAGELFDRGWAEFVQVRHQVGLASLGQFSPPQASPSPTPAPSSTATATPSGSASPTSSPTP